MTRINQDLLLYLVNVVISI